MAGPVSYLDVELRAKATQYNAEMQKAERRSQLYGAAAKKATDNTGLLSTGITNATGALSSMGGPLGGVVGQVGALSSVTSLSALAFTGLGAAVLGITSIMSGAASVYMEVEKRQAKTEALLRATGHSAGFAAFELDSMARSVALATLASTDDIREAQDVLLTFRSVRGKVFEETIKLSQDLAAVMGGTAKTAALQLGKALEDPLTGMNALRRSGVSFTTAEKEMVKQLVETNNVLKAQELILEKVKNQFGGAGEGEADKTLIGAVDTFWQRWEETLEIIGRTSGITETARVSLEALSESLLGWQYLLDPANTNGQKYFDELVLERQKLMEEMQAAGDPSKLSSMPIPGVFDKNDWYDSQRRLSEINAELEALHDANIEQQKKAALAREAADETARAADEEKRAADEAERRAKALEQLAKDQSKSSAGSKLYNDIMGIKEPKRKTDGPVEDNYQFRQSVRATDARIKDGDAVNAKHWLSLMKQSYESAMRDQNHNYDVEGMGQIIKRMELEALAKFGDLDKAAENAKANTPSALSVEGAGQSITLVADSALKLSESVNKMLGIDTSGKSIAEVTAGGKTKTWTGANAEEVTAEYKRQRDEAEAQARKEGGKDMGTMTIKVVTENGETTSTVNGEIIDLQNLARAFQRAAAAAPGA